MTTAAAMPLAVSPGPWFYATLVLPCRKCGMAPGEPCIGPRGGNRKRFHLQRYEDARETAGYPIRRSNDPNATVDIERPQRRADVVVTDSETHLDPPPALP